jgi:3-deoxy-D-manno-octulosonic acid (KDO) 8-phosphate synthase
MLAGNLANDHNNNEPQKISPIILKSVLAKITIVDKTNAINLERGSSLCTNVLPG